MKVTLVRCYPKKQAKQSQVRSKVNRIQPQSSLVVQDGTCQYSGLMSWISLPLSLSRCNSAQNMRQYLTTHSLPSESKQSTDVEFQ